MATYAHKDGAYAALIGILGNTGYIIPLGDTEYENGDRTEVETVGAAFGGTSTTYTYTYSSAITSWGTAPTETNLVPIVYPSADGGETPDADAHSHPGSAFSEGIWVKWDGSNAIHLLYRHASSYREFGFRIGTDGKGFLYLQDASSGGEIYTIQDAALTSGEWTHIIMTADGTADATGLNIYKNGAVAASTDVDGAAFVALENLGNVTGILYNTTGGYSTGTVGGGPAGPFTTSKEMTAQECSDYFDAINIGGVPGYAMSGASKKIVMVS